MIPAAFVLCVLFVCVTVVVLQRGYVPPIETVIVDEPPVPSLLEQRMRQQVIVTLKTGEAFRGVLFEHDDEVFVLRDAEQVGIADGRPTVTAVDGELVLLVSEVAYCQRP